MFNIYICGAVTGINSRNDVKHRKEIKDTLEDVQCLYNYKYTTNVFNPIDHYNYFDKKEYISERQVMLFELSKLRKCDLVIVDFMNPESLGTMAELSIAYELNIPIIGLNMSNKELHPWQLEMCNVVFVDMQKMCEYIQYNYLMD